MNVCRVLLAVPVVALLMGASSETRWTGPGRFCGYSPIIDLAEDESIEPLGGGIHGGRFRWTGAFGALEVGAIGWASKPKGRQLREHTATGQIRFAERRDKGNFVIAIWNGRQAVAYFTSPRRFTTEQLAAIGRVALFQEGEEPEPETCKYRMFFSWQ
jgi:hypothetical protein